MLQLGILLALYPLAQFLAAPVIGALSIATEESRRCSCRWWPERGCYVPIAIAVGSRMIGMLMIACLLAGLAQANVAVAQSAVADVAPVSQRNRLFG